MLLRVSGSEVGAEGMKTEKTVTLAVQMNVIVECRAEWDEDSESAIVISVDRIELPCESDVMEALDAADDFGQLDDEFKEATDE